MCTVSVNFEERRRFWWLENFFIASGNGATISEARDSALDAVEDTFTELSLGGLDNIYIKGSTTQKLVS